jgi:hypothetical protein
MPDVIETADALHASANRLYWQSRDTVEALAARLGMSRHALYSSIRPLPAGRECTGCGEPLAFANRTDREAGLARCAGCGAEEHVHAPAADAEAPPVPLKRPRRWGRVDAPEAVRRIRHELAYVRPERAAMIGGAAALGVAVGLVAVDVLRHMR